MPYIQSKIKYRIKDSFDAQSYADAEQSIRLLLGLRQHPVGMSFLFDEEDYASCTDPEFDGLMTYCLMVQQAAKGDWAYKSRSFAHSCQGGTTALGLEPVPEYYRNGKEFFSYQLYRTPAAARRLQSQIPVMDIPAVGITVKPLRSFTRCPDVALMLCDPYQSMRLVQAQAYFSGERVCIETGALQAICSEVTVQPYLSGKMSVSMLCSSTRMLCRWEDDLLAVGVPGEQIPALAQGLFATVLAATNKIRRAEIEERFREAGMSLPEDWGQEERL